MLYLTKTESKIVEFLKSGPKSAYDLEQEIDRAKDFSPDYIKVMVFKLNKKKKLVESYNENGERMYRLLGGGVEYRILEGVYNAMEEMQVLKYLACDTCAYRANAEVKRKVDKIYMGLVGFVGLLLLALWYYVGYSFSDVTIQVTKDQVDTMHSLTTKTNSSIK